MRGYMRRKRTTNKKKLLRFIFIKALIILLSGIIIYKFGNKNNNVKEDIKEEVKENDKISLIMVGDNLIHDKIYKEARKNANYNGYDFKPMYENIKKIVSNYDIGYYNQETILGGSDIGVSSYPSFNSPYEVGNDMIDAGFNLVSLATNHTLDRGEKAVLSSRNYWNNKSNVLAVGSYSSTEERNEVHVEEANGITYTMLNYTYGTNGIRVPSGKEYLVNVWPTDTDNINNPDVDTKYQEYKNTVKEDIDRVRDKVDVLIVAMHWGVEYTHEPTRYEKDMAQFLSDNGVDVIIGTHPHVIQPVTYINDTLVIYSLGNLISAQYQNQDTCTNYKCMVGAMTGFKITKTVKGNDKTIKISDVSTELIYTYYKNWRNFKVVPFSNEKIKDYLPSYMKTYETYKTVIQKYDSNMYVVPAYE